jgi:hypothetical protein
MNWLRLAAIIGGGTVIANADSKAAAAILAPVAACSAWAAVAFIHATYGAAAADIDIDDGPSHDPVSPDTTDAYEVAAEYNSAANSSHVAAAATIGADPGPACINSELTSGGSTMKRIATQRL